MIALDTNVLVAAHRGDVAAHDRARDALGTLADRGLPWAVPWPCVHEFLSVVTHPRIFRPPSTLEEALAEVTAWLESGTLVLLAETEGYFEELAALLRSGRIAGPKVHDARIAALCRLHGVRELWSADRDFGRFPGLKVRNPLVG
ncbi:MAG: type II toxin-antitoxin system VapC family toxin [Acidithiobacillales bacterium]